MRSLSLLLLMVSLSRCTFAWQTGHRDIHPEHAFGELQRRNIVYNSQIASAYDFVIVGGGTAGLALASRLSEDSNTTVLVLEAGDTGDAVADRINVPANAYYQGLPGSSYDWKYETVKQTQAASRQLVWPRGKVLGGSSAMNGMYHIRPSKVEVDTWASLVEGGSDKWSWDKFFAAMQASETFTPPSSTVQQEGNIQFVATSRGTSGPVHVSYPGFMLPVVGNWTSTLANVGVASNDDAYNGDGWGTFIATSSINPSNWTRSYARSAYIDPLPPRSNLAILPNATATRIIFDVSNANNLTATGVKWASFDGAVQQVIQVNKEVILASGTIGSPQLLQLSGVGPSDILKAAGVNVLLNLPGVGQHLQDHISTEVTWTADIDTAGTLHANDADGNTAAFMSFINSATAYVNVTDLLGDWASQFQQEIAANYSSSLANLCPSTDPTVQKGYELIFNNTLNTFLMSPIGQVEILLSLTSPGSISVQAALQHPFSQGRIYITSNDAFTPPAIDPQYLSHPADIVVLREGLKLARKIGQTAPLSSALGKETYPGSSVQTDDDWDAWLATTIGTEYHPSSTCAMLPLDAGGVVDPNLKVYGLANVRVVDASVYPFSFSAHLQAPTYGLAEQAADIIRATYNGVGWPSANGANSVSNTNTSTTTALPSSTSSTQPKNGASTLSHSNSFVLVITGALIALLL